MKPYRTNSLIAGLLYFLGSAFGVLSAVVGGEVISSIVKTKPLPDLNLQTMVADHSGHLIGGAFLILLMGISLVAMTVFLYPVFKRDSKELALGLLLFRGALEGTWYFITALSVLLLVVIGQEYVATGATSAALHSMGMSVYRFQDLLGPVGTIFFLLGATCLYISFYRTNLIPRWLSIWGLIAVVPYMAYALLHLFQKDHGIGFYLQMLLAPQEMVMALWLIIKGFNQTAVNNLIEVNP